MASLSRRIRRAIVKDAAPVNVLRRRWRRLRQTHAIRAEERGRELRSGIRSPGRALAPSGAAVWRAPDKPAAARLGR